MSDRAHSHDIEIPLGKRTKQYRFFEMVPFMLSVGAILLLVVLSLISPLLATIYLMLAIITMFVKAIGIAAHTIKGRRALVRAQKIDWHNRLSHLEDPVLWYSKERSIHSNGFGFEQHKANLAEIAQNPEAYPKPSQLYNAVIVAMYNESFDVLDPTLQSLLDTTYDNQRLIVTIAYEERGGAAARRVVKRLEKKYGDKFKAFQAVMHPKDLPGEVVGKGGNITYAGRQLKEWIDEQQIPHSDVIITTLDSDNRPHRSYFDYVTYEYIVHEDRKHMSYQPVSLFFNNIWDAPAPMRVIATGNSFWNIISSMRPHMLRNFASHSQSLDALVETDFWSTRTIVEDGHQYWRSYVAFKGDYMVAPVYVPIYQDAVLSDTYWKTLKAQFVQLRRWAYGASDVPYMAGQLFTKRRAIPFWPGLARFFRLLDGHVTLACIAVLVAFGAWVPLFLNAHANQDMIAHQLPVVVSYIQRAAMFGLFITMFASFTILPPRPARYKRRRSFFMVLQWVLMPVTSIAYSAASAYTAHTRLFFGKYLDVFDVTDKATHKDVARAKAAKKEERARSKSKTTS